VHDSNPKHVSLLVFPKTAHVRFSKAQRVADLAKAAHVQDSAGKIGARAEPVSDDDWYRALGARLRAYRMQRGASVKDAAAVAGRSEETWLNYERSGRGHILWPILKFAEHYGISLDDLIMDP
jgi:hypothetical protein